MSSFEEYAYCSYLKEQNLKQQEDIDEQVYKLLVKKQELTHKLAIQFDSDLITIQKEVGQEIADIIYKLRNSKRLIQ